MASNPARVWLHVQGMHALVQNLNFGSDSMIGGSQHHGASFREVSQPDSLHIVLSTRPDPTSKLPIRPTCSVHLDSVSPVAGRDPTTRKIIYDHGKVLQHIATVREGDAWKHRMCTFNVTQAPAPAQTK